MNDKTNANRSPRPSIMLLGMLLLGAAPFPTGARSGELYVAPDGDDGNPGTKAKPFATLARLAATAKPGDTCYLREGVYREVLRPKFSGTKDAPIVFRNCEGERAVLSGADVLSDWKEEGKGVWSAAMDWSMPDGNQVFADGAMMIEACWPSMPTDDPLFKPSLAKASGGSATTITCGYLPGADDCWVGAELWCAGGMAWIFWTASVTDYDAKTHTLTFEDTRGKWQTTSWHLPKRGSRFLLRGLRSQLDVPKEWFYEAEGRRLLLIPPEGKKIEDLVVEAKRRVDCVDLNGRSHVRIEGLAFRAGGIRTNGESSHLVLKGLHGRYVSHSYRKNVSRTAGVLIHGNDILVLNCDLAYSSGTVLSIQGRDNRVINCHIHHGCYGATFSAGAVALGGRRTVFSHNTVRHAGRDLINQKTIAGLIQYNDTSDAGWLTTDLGMFYAHNHDYANSVFRYNYVHDNRAASHGMGIYFDHCSHNAIVHHNVVWNVAMGPVNFNNPAYGNLAFNNTCWRTGRVSSFDHSHRDDLFACRFERNIFNTAIRLPRNATVKDNLVAENPPFRNREARDFRLKKGHEKDVGAYPPGATLWRVGWDPENPPDPLPVWEPPKVPWMNGIRNACFERDELEDWQETDAKQAKLTPGNGWGNAWGNRKETEPTGTSRRELRLGPQRDGVQQTVTGLLPGVTYTLSAWMRVSDKAETVELSASGYGGEPVSVSVSSTRWVRKSVTFKTGPQADRVTVHLRKTSGGEGHAWCDNLTLPLRPPPSEE
jgi:hypothetical protein